MVELLIVVVMGLLVISAAATLGPRMGFAAPLLLVVAGIGTSLLPFVPEVHVEPEWILSGVLPPLLYSASVSMPSMNFRREFGAISGLSFVLVVVSSLALGAVFAWLIPGLELAWGIALGADQGDDQKRLTLDVISARRKALLDARDDGNFSADALNAALAVLDADQISPELKGAPIDYS